MLHIEKGLLRSITSTPKSALLCRMLLFNDSKKGNR